jgi:hypothetical protein
MKVRYGPRVPVNFPVTFSSEGRVGHGLALNVSVPGCLLETRLKLRVGQSLQLLLPFDGNVSPLRIGLAVVRWTEPPRAGLEFIRMSAPDQERLRVYVSSRVDVVALRERLTDDDIPAQVLAQP